MFSASMVNLMRNDCRNRPSREPSSIVSRVISRSASISGVMSVAPVTMPAALAITLWDTSKTAMTILNVLDRIRMAQVVLNTHL